MSVAKAELKIAITNDIGATIEDSFEAAKKELYRHEGAVNAYAQAAKSCEALAEHVKKDIDEGVYDLQTGEHVNRYVARAAALQRNLHRQAENLCVAAAGKIAGFESVMEMLRKYRNAEQLRLNDARVQETAVDTTPNATVIEMRPGLSIKQRRQLEVQHADTDLVSVHVEETVTPLTAAASVAECVEETARAVTEDSTSILPRRRGRPPKKRD